jgi:hypothetical protein
LAPEKTRKIEKIMQQKGVSAQKIDRKGSSSDHMSLKSTLGPRKMIGKAEGNFLMSMDFEKTYRLRDRFVEAVIPSGDWKVKGSITRHINLWRQI